MNESLRNVELPILPLEANSLTFGDWLVTIESLLADVSSSAGDWWATTIKGVEEHYATWLSSEPLQRLRLDPGPSAAATKWPRTERRMTSLLLQAVPEVIRSEAVAARKLSASHLLFTLFVKDEPHPLLDGPEDFWTNVGSRFKPEAMASVVEQGTRAGGDVAGPGDSRGRPDQDLGLRRQDGRSSGIQTCCVSSTVEH